MKIIIELELDEGHVDENHPSGLTQEAFDELHDSLESFGGVTYITKKE